MSTHVLPLVPPVPGYFRWQKFLSASKLPTAIRGMVPSLDAGEDYWLALGGSGGFSADSIKYPHRFRPTQIMELPLGDLVEGGLSVNAEFVTTSWVDGSGTTIVETYRIKLDFGHYEEDAHGNQKWVLDAYSLRATTDFDAEIDDLPTEQATHCRVVWVEVAPVLVVVSTFRPTYEPLFFAPACVLTLE